MVARRSARVRVKPRSDELGLAREAHPGARAATKGASVCAVAETTSFDSDALGAGRRPGGSA